jgi:hypothetical protein
MQLLNEPFFSHLQNALPANGAPVSRQRTGRTREMYQEYVMQRTQSNWKFWIVSGYLRDAVNRMLINLFLTVWASLRAAFKHIHFYGFDCEHGRAVSHYNVVDRQQLLVNGN